MIRIYLLIVCIILAFLLLRWFITSPPRIVAEYLKKSGIVIIAVLLVFMALMGKLNWLFALCGVIFASIARALPLLLRYAPQLKRFWILFNSARKNTSEQTNEKVVGAKMSRAQAYEVLGLKPGATKQEIIQAHRKLMQKVHPDHGGSDFLAAQINKAKRTLLD